MRRDEPLPLNYARDPDGRWPILPSRRSEFLPTVFASHPGRFKDAIIISPRDSGASRSKRAGPNASIPTWGESAHRRRASAEWSRRGRRRRRCRSGHRGRCRLGPSPSCHDSSGHPVRQRHVPQRGGMCPGAWVQRELKRSTVITSYTARPTPCRSRSVGRFRRARLRMRH